MLKVEIKCLIMYGHSTDELIKQSGGEMVDATRYGNTEGNGISPISGK